MRVMHQVEKQRLEGLLRDTLQSAVDARVKVQQLQSAATTADATMRIGAIALGRGSSGRVRRLVRE